MFKGTDISCGETSDLLVLAVTEVELLWLPLLVVTVMVYRHPGVRTLKMHWLASQERILWDMTVASSACLRTTVKLSHSPTGRFHWTLRLVSSEWRMTSCCTGRGAGGSKKQKYTRYFWLTNLNQASLFFDSNLNNKNVNLTDPVVHSSLLCYPECHYEPSPQPHRGVLALDRGQGWRT